MKLIMATGNQNKVREIREMLEGSGIEIISMKDAGITADIEENGTTFEENAAIKAEAIRDLSGQMVLADDSGLMIDAMGGGPGVHSSRSQRLTVLSDTKSLSPSSRCVIPLARRSAEMNLPIVFFSIY